MRSAAFAVVGATTTLLAACAALSGASDLAVGDPASTTEAGAVPPDGGSQLVDSATTAEDTSTPPVQLDGAPLTPCATCVPSPAGWEGPFVVLMEGSFECPTGFTRTWERKSTTSTNSPAAQCTCTCGEITGASCAAEMSEFDDPRCSGSLGKRALTVGRCTETSIFVESVNVTVRQNGGLCVPNATTNVTPLSSTTVATGCTSNAEGTCAAGNACVPSGPTGSKLCVRNSDANAACPAAYPTAVSLPEGVEDTRGCSPCTCPATVSCTVNYTVYEDDECGPGPSSSHVVPECSSNDSAEAVKLTALTPQGSCAPQGGTPIGSVQPQATSRLCCQ